MTGRAGFRQEEQGQPLMMIEEILIPWFILVCLLTLYLSCRQTPPDDPERKEYATAAVILFLVCHLDSSPAGSRPCGFEPG